MGLLDFLFPKKCVSCRKIGGYFCQKCLEQIEILSYQICPICAGKSIDGFTHFRCKKKYTIDGMYAPFGFRGGIKDAIYEMKYRHVYSLGEILTDLLIRNTPRSIWNFDILIPVPLHAKKERERGFNQAYILAKILGRKLNIEVDDNIVIRRIYNKPQAKLTRIERRQNVRGIFQVVDQSNISGRRVGLIDDVATTRSTIRECALNLKRAKAKSVWGIVLAHG